MIAYFGYFLDNTEFKMEKSWPGNIIFRWNQFASKLQGKLLTHPSPNPTLTLTFHIRLNLEEGRWVASQRVPKIISSWSHVRPEFFLSTQKNSIYAIAPRD